MSASNHSALVSVAIRPSLPCKPSHSSYTGHNGNDCKLLSSSQFLEGGGSGVNEMPVDGFHLPPGMASDEFSLYVAVDADVQTVAEVTDEELCAGQQAAGDVDTDGEMSSEATAEADDSRQQPSQVTLSNALLCLDTVCAYMEMADCDSYEVQEIATVENND